jgi:hypothetical protein
MRKRPRRRTLKNKMPNSSMTNQMNTILDQVFHKYPSARKIPVENFLMSAQGEYFENLQNFHRDAKLYRWDASVRNAIKYGLRLLRGELTWIR